MFLTMQVLTVYFAVTMRTSPVMALGECDNIRLTEIHSKSPLKSVNEKIVKNDRSGQLHGLSPAPQHYLSGIPKTEEEVCDKYKHYCKNA